MARKKLENTKKNQLGTPTSVEDSINAPKKKGITLIKKQSISSGSVYDESTDGWDTRIPPKEKKTAAKKTRERKRISRKK